MRTYYHVTIYLVFPSFFIFSFSSKSSFAIFKQRKVYYEKHKVHFLLSKSSIFAFIPWPIGYLWPEVSFPSWNLTQGSKQSFETALINLRWQVFAEKFQLSRDIDISPGRKTPWPRFQLSYREFGENNEIEVGQIHVWEGKVQQWWYLALFHLS